MRIIFAILFIIFFAGGTYAQLSGNRVMLDENSIVKDSSGRILPAKEWQGLLSSGHYTMRSQKLKDKDPEFTLIRLTEDQYAQRLQNAPKPRETNVFSTGQKISSFKATDINGNKYKLKDLEGKIVVINFWFIACEPCRREMPELNKIVEEFKDSSNVIFLAICLDEKDRIEKYLQTTPFSYNIIDQGNYISTQYGIKTYPTNLVVGKNGKVAFHSSGYSMSVAPWIRKTILQELGE